MVLRAKLQCRAYGSSTMQTAVAHLAPEVLRSGHVHRRFSGAVRHRADDAAEHALPVHGLPDRLPALARRRGGAGGPGAGAGAASCSRRRACDAVRERIAALAAPTRDRARWRLRRRSSSATAPPSARRSRFLQGRDPTLAHRIVGRALPARGPALRRARRLRRRRRRRPAGLGLRRAGHCRTARGTSPPCTSTTSPTCCATRSIRASSSCATPSRWRPASPPSIRWPQALAAPPNLVDRTLRRADARRRVERHRPDAGAGVGAVPRHRLRALPHRAGDQGAATRRSSPCSAAATSTPSCASSPSRACSTTSTTSRSTTASARCWRCSSTCRASARRSGWCAPSCATTQRQRALHRRRRARRAVRRRRHADLGRPAARPLPVAARHAQPDAPAVVRRALEQAHRGARLLLEEVQLLRRQPRLHRALRARRRHDAGRPHRGHRRGDRADRLPLRRRGRAAQGAAGAGRRAAAAQASAITWWGNIRFEKSFTPELCRLLADSGCIAISGGLEVASDRLLTLMKKGVTVEQVARVTRASPTPASWCTPT